MAENRRAGDSARALSRSGSFPTGKIELLLREVGFRFGELWSIGARAADFG